LQHGKLWIRRWQIIDGEERRIAEICLSDANFMAENLDTEGSEKLSNSKRVDGIWEVNDNLQGDVGVKFLGRYLGSFWSHLATLCTKGEKWIVAGWKMYETLCAAGMFDAIESGKVRITDSIDLAIKKGKRVKSKRFVGSMICQSPPTIIDAVLDNGSKLCFVDLANFGLSKSQFCDDPPSLEIDMATQAIQDHIVMLRELDMGKLCMTAAAQGYYTFRRSHMKDQLVAHEHTDARKLERAAYFGGRCEAYKLGKLPGTWTYIDIRSMYTCLARSCMFPTDLVDYIIYPHFSELPVYDSSKMIIADCTIETDVAMFPLRYDRRVIFPIGKFRTQLCHPEFCDAFELGIVKHVHQVNVYSCAAIYCSFAKLVEDSLSRLDFLGLLHMRPTLKLIVNASFGKIGSRSKDWVHVPDKANDKRWEQWWQKLPHLDRVTMWRCMDGVVEYSDAEREQARSLPSISGTMNSHGRVLLGQLLLDPKLSGHIAYCDTDGMIVDEWAVRYIHDLGLIGNNIGEYCEKEESNDVEIFGIKHYRFGERVVCAGIPAESAKIVDGRIYYKRHQPIYNSLWQGTAFETGIDVECRRNHSPYRHGKVNHDLTISPWIIGEVENVSERSADGNSADKAYRILGYKDTVGRQRSGDDSSDTV
jgi:hypothetical protein